MMSFASHPYAAASTSSPLKRASRAAKRPSISARPMSYLPDLEEEDDGVSRAFFDGDSPLGKLANLSLDKASKRISKPRPIGLNGTERMSLQMLFEARPSPSRSQQSPVDTVNIDGLTLDFPRPPLTISPSPSVSTSPSTPGMPLTPSSSDSEHETFEMPVKPLSFASKSSTPEKDSLSRHDTMTRRLFAPLDTVAANKLSLGLNPELELSLTGMLEEMRERKAGQDEDEDDESAWIDEEDEYAGHDYYRADIATHLDIFSSPLSPSSSKFSPPSSLRHRRHPSSSSSSSHVAYFPPARPDSMPPPPHFAKDSLISPFRRTSASSLASTISASSVRSNGSRTSKSKRTSNRVRASIARSRASRSSMALKANSNMGKDLPPTPHAPDASFGPSSLLDPSFPRRRIPSFVPPPRAPPPPPPSAFRMAKRSTRPPPRSSLPVDIDFDAGDDDLVDFVDPFQDGFVEIVCPDDMPSKEDPVSPLDVASLPFSPSSLSLDLGAPSVMQSDCSPAPDSVSFLSSDPYDCQTCDGDEYEPDRALRSRWSMSTLGSIEAPASSARSLFPAIPKIFQSRQRTPKPESPKKEKEPKVKATKKPQRESASSESPRGFPFFPTPSPPSPKRKTLLGPGPFKYNGAPTPSSSSPSKSSFVSTAAPSSPGPSPNSKISHSPSPSASSQYIPYTPQHKQKASVSTPASSDTQSSFSFAMSASSSTHRFLPGSPSRGLRRSNSRASTSSDMSGTSRGSCESGSSTGSSGLRRKPIPIEIFLR